VNLIAGERIVPELVQKDVNAERIIAETRGLLDNPQVRITVAEKLAQLRDRLGGPGAGDRVADLALALMV
jgi:lipid-A-disaccharide synthase